MKKIMRKEVVIGLLVILALAILFFGINFLKGINIFKAANYYYVSYENVTGLAQSAPVTLNGFKTGLVREIAYDYSNPGHVVVEISVDKALQLPRGTRAVLESDLLGTATIALVPGNPADGFYTVGDTLVAATKPGLMDGLSENLMPSISGIFPKIDTLLTSLNTIASDPALKAGIGRIDDITAELETSLKRLSRLTADLAPVGKNVSDITSNVDTITGDLTHLSGQLRNVPVDSLVAELQATVANLHTLSAQLSDPNGTVGKLTGDPALYDNVNATIISLDSLFTDIKKNPKRYINIKVF